MSPKIPIGVLIEEPEPNNQNIKKYSINDIFATYIGTKDETQEIAICKKEIDENNQITYLDLLTKKRYTNIPSEKEIYVQKEYALLALLAYSEFKSTTLLNGYLTNSSLVTLYNALNTDLEYKCLGTWIDDAEYGCPIYLERAHNEKELSFIHKDDKNWINTKIALNTTNKIIVISGDNGIGKSATKWKIYKKDPNHLSDIYANNHLREYSGPVTIDYKELKKGTFTTLHLKNRVKKAVNYMITHKDKKFNNGYLIIDNIDFSNTTFAEIVRKETEGTNLKVILISDRKINDQLLDNNFFNIIQYQRMNEKIIERIFRYELPAERTFNSQEETKELINILLDCDKQSSINITNHDNNPKLGLTIIKNAKAIQKATYNNVLTIDHFIEALNLENINMDEQTKEKTIKNLEELNEKIRMRKENENAEAKQKKKFFGFKKNK